MTKKGENHYRKLSKRVLLGLLIISLISGFLITKLEFDFDFEKFFPKDDPQSDFYKDYRKNFDSDNDFVLIALVNNDGLFQKDFLANVDNLVEDLSLVKNIDQVLAITNAKDFKSAPGTGQIYEIPVLRFDQPEKYASDSLRLTQNENWFGTIVSRDMKSTALWVRHKQYLSKFGCDTLSYDLNNLMAEYEFDEVHMMGRSIGQVIYVDMMKEEMILFMSLSFVLVVIFLLLAFRTFWGVWVPALVVILAIVWNLAIIKLLGQKIDTMLTILPTIIFVVGMSDIVHFLTRYLAELRLGMNKIAAIKITIKEVGLATLLTSLTTALGFITLVTSPIVPIANFGLYTALGVILAFILAFTLLPSILVLLHQPQVKALKDKDFWRVKMHHLFIFSLRNRKAILIGTTFIFGFCFWAITLVQSNNFLLQDLKENHPLKKEMRYFEKQFSGARPLEVAVIYDEGVDHLSPEVMNNLMQLEDYLKQQYGMMAVTSFHKLLQKTDEVISGKKTGFQDSQKRINKAYKFLKGRDEIVSRFYSPENNMSRIYGQTADLGRIYYKEKNENLETFMSETLTDAPFEIQLTGTATLMDRSNEILSTSMLKGLGLAFILIALLFGFLFRSIPMLFISLIPNILPLVLIGAIMGVFEIEFKFSTAIIFTIIFGIAVDDTIHFLSKFRMEIRKGKPLLYAMKRTFMTSGKAIIVTSLILIAGFLTLILSDFQGTFYIGLLLSLALVFAVFADLLLLPVLLWYFYKGK